MRRSITFTVLLLGLLSAGILAGMVFAEGAVMYPLIRSLEPSDAILFCQRWYPFLNYATRMAAQSTILVCLIAMIFFSSGRPRWLLIGSLVCYAAMLGLVFNFGGPNAGRILQLDPLSPPLEWGEMIEHSATVSSLRAICAGLAFLLQIVAFGTRKT